MSDRSRRLDSRRGRRLPARVYWFRRGLLVSLVVLLGWGGTALVGGGDEVATRSDGADVEASSDRATKPHPSGGRGDTSPGVQQGVPGPVQTVSRSVPVTTRLARPTADCAPESVAVAAQVRGRVQAGQPVRLELVLSREAGDACRLRLGGGQLLAQVVNPKGVSVWDVGDCPRELAVTAVTLRRGWQTAVALTWSGRKRDRSCVGATEPVEPGTYELRVAVVGGEPASAEFGVAAARRQT